MSYRFPSAVDERETHERFFLKLDEQAGCSPKCLAFSRCLRTEGRGDPLIMSAPFLPTSGAAPSGRPFGGPARAPRQRRRQREDPHLQGVYETSFSPFPMSHGALPVNIWVRRAAKTAILIPLAWSTQPTCLGWCPISRAGLLGQREFRQSARVPQGRGQGCRGLLETVAPFPSSRASRSPTAPTATPTCLARATSVNCTMEGRPT